MTRMTREFSLVLVGASILTAGYYLWPEQDFDKRTEEKVRARVGGGSSHGHVLVWIHGGRGYSSAGRTSASVASFGRGGFGSIGGRVGGGFGG
jgi:hypothetical protein